ncbi:MauE/DoxX family redox-associated membrane protein [candidate division CSSED10-310 bacterium]|uniref:MauE/DoxX family redox-associated membrane protein n=1 Tax=candidate division CSSED10-310 bacterium TaxID=2855610 RepID=A0ABV6YRU3_UNCC1
MKKLGELLIHPYLVLIFRLIVGITFIYASYFKILDPADFGRSIFNYRLLPIFLVNIFAIIFPWLEFFCGVMLLAGLFTRANALIISILLLVFSIAILSVIFRGIDVECGCFKENRTQNQVQTSLSDQSEKVFTDKVGWSLLGRDVLMILMLLVILFSRTSALEVDHLLKFQRSRT